MSNFPSGKPQAPLTARERWHQRMAALRAQEPGPLPGDAERNAEMAEVAQAISEGQFQVVPGPR